MEFKNYQHMQGMTPQQQTLFLSELNGKQKSTGTGLALAIIFGPWALNLYLGKTGLGILFLFLQVLAVLTFNLIVPIFVFFGWYIYGMCTARGAVERHNEDAAVQAAAIAGLVAR